MADELKQGTLLRNGTYRIEKTLGQGGFGITYLARDLTLDILVAIKEFFPKEYCGRDFTSSRVATTNQTARDTFSTYKNKFLKEARNIAKLKHPGIIKIYGAFEENDTAYYVMEHIDGMSLGKMVSERGALSVSRALEYIKGVGEALSYVHARSMTHLDVKPDNIMVRREDNTPILIDFGLSKQYDASGSQTSATPLGISHGYAPLEQYIAGGVSKFSPQTDIYSLAATLYFLLSGENPLQAPKLIQEGLRFPATIPMSLQGPIATAMAANPAQRYPSVAAFLAALSSPQPSSQYSPQPKADDHTVIDAPVATPQPAPRPESPRSESPRPNPIPRKPSPSIGIQDKPKKIDKRILLWGGVGLAAVLAGVLLIAFWPKENPGTPELPSTEEPAGLHYNESTSELVLGSNRYKMVKVDDGTFSMGATSEQENPDSDEEPVHRVTLSSYSIGQTEVPQWLWEAVMGYNPSYFKGDNLPVENVSWDDCQEFISELNSITGINFRLPTEAQWEFAARGGNRSNGYQYSGSNNIDDVAWYKGNSGDLTHEVGTKSTNELGLYDMTGNVLEWCSDWYGAYPDYSVTNPEGLYSGSLRVFRGGGWSSSPWDCRVAIRRCSTPFNRDFRFGFRLVL